MISLDANMLEEQFDPDLFKRGKTGGRVSVHLILAL